MNPYGAAIRFPFEADVRGAFISTDVPEEIVAQAIADLIETKRGERVMVPDYGLSDWLFSVQDRTFITRVADELEQQIKRYVPFVKSLKITGATDEQGRAELNLSFELVGLINAPKNLTYPVWRLAEQ